MNANPERLRQMPNRAFAQLGIEGVAYVKPVVVDEVSAWAVHAADGTQLAVLAEREQALATIVQNGLEPASVH